MRQIFKHLYKSFINICLCRYYRIRGVLSYPIRILSKYSFLTRLRIEELLAAQQVYLARRSEKTPDKNFNDNGVDITLREDALEPRKIPQLSLNVLGGFFLPMHTRFRVSMKTFGDEKWSGKPVYLAECRNQYTELENGSTIYFNANALHEAWVDYERLKDKNSEKIYDDFHTAVNGKYNLKAQITIAHEPTNLNYWHSELKVWLDGSELGPGENAKWVKGVGQQIISDLICINAYPNLPRNRPIDPSYFYKSSKNNRFYRFLNRLS